MRILIDQSKVKEKVDALSSTQLSRLKGVEKFVRVDIMLLCSHQWTSISDESPKCYLASIRS
jgi:hypothetical protein